MKIAVAVGHTQSGTIGSGAVGFLNESNCTREIAPLLVKYLNSNGHQAKEFRIDKGNTYLNEDCYERASQANNWGADLYIEIHLNAVDDKSANGTEVLVCNDTTKAIEYAKRVNNKLVSALGTQDRTFGKGYKTSGVIVLKKTSMPALLVECLFCSNQSDSNKYNADRIAKAIAEGILNKSINTTSATDLSKNFKINMMANIESTGIINTSGVNSCSIGTTGKSKRLEMFSMTIDGIDFDCMVHMENVGDIKGIEGQALGSVGIAKRLEGITITVKSIPTGYKLLYRVHMQNKGWSNWCTSGQYAGTKGEKLRIESVDVKIEKI